VRRYPILATVMAMTVASPQDAKAENPPSKLQGSFIQRIDDNAGPGSCIGSADKLTVTLRRVILQKNSSWWGLIQDKSFGITLTTTVTGTSGGDTKAASFAKVINESVAQFGTGQISLGQEQSLLSKYSLTNGSNVFTVVDINVGVVRTEGKSVAANILLGAVGATKSLALPTNPFTSEYTIATNYVNSVFTPLLNQAAADKAAVSDNITMNIDAANCSGDDEKTGTKAIIEAASGPNTLDTTSPQNYCIAADLKPTFVLKFARKPPSGSCDGVAYASVQNPYIAFYVNSIPTVAVQPKAQAVADLKLPLGEASAPDALAVRSALKALAVPTSAADTLARALVSAEPSAKVADAFGIAPSAVERYREAISRCKANAPALSACFR
jgi:hypothetical protein